MVIKNFSVSLDEEIVNQAKKKMKIYGGKLSPWINERLKELVELEEEVEDGNNE